MTAARAKCGVSGNEWSKHAIDTLIVLIGLSVNYANIHLYESSSVHAYI